ncbi:MAG: hypothetical protein LUG93_10245 [Lachnospiraceae bacterium]|nr:hypothetical protein [Lachnospiraceae bacterium]
MAVVGINEEFQAVRKEEEKSALESEEVKEGLQESDKSASRDSYPESAKEITKEIKQIMLENPSVSVKDTAQRGLTRSATAQEDREKEFPLSDYMSVCFITCLRNQSFVLRFCSAVRSPSR